MISIRLFADWLRTRARLKTILHGALSAFAGKGTALLVNLITLPLTIRYLGRVEYGIWVTISSTVLLLGVLDLGIASTLTNYIAKANTTGDRKMASDYFATAFYVTVLVAGLLGSLGYLVWSRVAWGPLLGVQDPELARQATRCVAIAVLFFFLNLPLTLATRVFGGYQQIQVANYFAMLGSGLNLLSIVGGIKAHLSIVGLMVLFSCSMLASNFLLNFYLVIHDKPWLRPRLSSVRAEFVRNIFGDGLRFFVLQLSGLIVFNSDIFVITHFLGAGEVAPYAVSGRLMSFAVTLHTLLIPVFWPAFSDAFHRGDLTWVRRTYRRLVTYTVGAVSLLALIFAVSGRWIIQVWATKAAVPSQALLWSMAAWIVVLAISTNQACLLAATQRMGLQAITSTLAAIFNLVISVYLVQSMGAVGVVLGSIASYLLFVIGPQQWEVRRILHVVP